MGKISIPFIKLKECFPKGIDIEALENTNIDKAIQLLRSFIKLSWEKFFPEEPYIDNGSREIEKDKNCISYTINLHLKDTNQDCFYMLAKCIEFANKIEIILKPFKKRVRINILCDSCKRLSESGEKLKEIAFSDRIGYVEDFVEVIKSTSKKNLKYIFPAEYYFEELENINNLIEHIESISKKLGINSEETKELQSIIIELLIAYGAMKEDCNMCTSYRLYEVLEILTKKFNLEWEELGKYFNKNFIPNDLRSKSLKNILKTLTYRMNRPLSELSTEERHAKVKTTNSRKKNKEEIPPLKSEEVCQVIEELLKATLRKITKDYI